MVREAGASVRTALFPFARLHPLPAPRPIGDRLPVVLVHGFLGHPDMLRPLARTLLSAGWPEVVRVGWPPLGVDLDALVRRIAGAARPHATVDLVGHSLGAFACRAWLKQGDGPRFVRRFVALAGPFGGTSLHRLVPGALGRALDPDGEVVRRLAEGPEPVPTTVIRARWDHQVLPHARGAIAGTRDVVVEGHGHNGLLWSAEAHAAVVEALL
jgi:alpha-beta hydrolase superfamily lysophospholipase